VKKVDCQENLFRFPSGGSQILKWSGADGFYALSIGQTRFSTAIARPPSPKVSGSPLLIGLLFFIAYAMVSMKHLEFERRTNFG